MAFARIRPIAVALTLVMGVSCASRTPAPVLAPATPKYTEYIFPVVPPALARSLAAPRLDAGWRLLQGDDLKGAERELTAGLASDPRFHPAHAALGYVALARRDPQRAIREFDAALKGDAAYVPALVGRGQALLGESKEDEAIAAFEAALAADSSLTDVRRRLDVLKFRGVQEEIGKARSAAKAGRLDEAAAIYRRALVGSPDTAFLHHELGNVERRRGDTAAALLELRRATELDPSDVEGFVALGELLEQQRDFDGADTAYRAAQRLEPSDDVARRLARIAEQTKEARLPPEFRALGSTEQITRGDLAALIGIRLGDLLQTAKPRQVVATDARGHWANQWIGQVARAGVMDPFANHAFQPRARLRRVDLAAAVSRMLTLIGSTRPDLRAKWTTERPKIADVGPGHLSYPEVSLAVASGVMPLTAGDRFLVSRPVTGAEAIEVIDRLRALAAAR